MASEKDTDFKDEFISDFDPLKDFVKQQLLLILEKVS